MQTSPDANQDLNTPLLQENSFWLSHRRHIRGFLSISLAIIAIIVIWWIVAASTRVKAPRVFQPPASFALDFELSLPYSGLREKGFFQAGRDKYARVSYYHGLTNYIYNATSQTAFAVLPRIDKMTCFREAFEDMPVVFPDLTHFVYEKR